MIYHNLFAFVITHVAQLNGEGRGVVIVRGTPLQDITKAFDEFLQREDVKQAFQYTKETNEEFPEMIMYKRNVGTEHIVFGKNEQGWKGDYGLTHTDVVVSVH